MALPLVSILTLCVLIILFLYRFVVYPLFFSPLARIPSAHWSAPLSNVWIQYYRIKQKATPTVHEAHQKHGPVIQIAPDELSINCIDGGVRTIYPGGYEKGTWYSNVFNNFDLRPMFCMEDRHMHSKRKRMISNVYAKSTLQSSKALQAISQAVLYGRLLELLTSFAEQDAAFDMYDVYSAVTMDMVAAYAVGLKNGSDFLGDLEYCAKFTRDFKTRQVFNIWAQELPIFTKIVTMLGLRTLLIPAPTDCVNADIETWILGMCDKAELIINSADDHEHPENYPTVYAQLRSSMIKDVKKQELSLPIDQVVRSYRFEIASEIVDHVIAGFDTSSITLTWLTWQLSKPCNAEWQLQLQNELRDTGKSTDPKTIDALPVLEAILMESLRLHAAIPGNQPRITPPDAELGPPGQVYSGLPANIRVQAQAWSLHRNADVFPDPESWQPGRWLHASEEQHKEMMRWFWAFGSGGRMCVGSNLALYEMKAIITLIWSRFSTSIVYDEGMIPNGGYQAEPVGKDGRMLEVRLKRL